MTVNPARLREIAQAAVGYLNLATQSWHGQFSFTAQRSYWANYALSDLDTANGGSLKVDILLGLQDWQPESRGQEEGDYLISVVLQQKVDRTVTADLDSLIDLVAAIADAFLIGKTFVPAWSASTAYVVGDFALLSEITYRCNTAHTNHTPPNGTYWDPVNPIMLLEKHNPILYSPKEGDNRNKFISAIDLLFRHDK